MDQKALMKEVSRVLKPGGVIVFSDIMQGDGGGDCTSFTGQNVVASMASPVMYKVWDPPYCSRTKLYLLPYLLAVLGVFSRCLGTGTEFAALHSVVLIWYLWLLKSMVFNMPLDLSFGP